MTMELSVAAVLTRSSLARVITSAAIVTQSLFTSLWVFFGITALVLCGLIFVVARSSARKDRP